ALQDENAQLHSKFTNLSSEKDTQLKIVQEAEREISNKYMKQLDETKRSLEEKLQQEKNYYEKQVHLLKSALAQEQEKSIELSKKYNEVQNQLVSKTC